jgi:hypothetical protein
MAARWRDGAVPLASGPARTWHWWLVRNLTVYAGACACSKAQARERVASACGCAAPTADRRKAARRRGRCRREAARACMRMGVRAHERPGARTIGRNDTTEGDASARLGEMPVSSVRSRNRKKRVGLYPFPGQRVCVRRCTGAWISARVHACACRGHNHGDGRENSDEATTGKSKRQNEEERPASGAARAAKAASTPARNDIPAWLEGRHHTTCARRHVDVSRNSGEHTRRSRTTATLARRLGATEVRDEDALTYS